MAVRKSSTPEQSREPVSDSQPYMGDASDPINELFGPDSRISPIFEEDSYDIPEEVQTALAEHGLTQRTFRCMLRGGAPGDGANTANAPYIKSWVRSIPTVEWIAKHYGPGDYSVVISWRAPDPKLGKERTFTQTIPIIISEKQQDEYDEFQLKLRVERAKRNRSAVRNAKLQSQLEYSLEDDEPEDKKKAAREYIQEFTELATALGWNKGGGSGSVDWSEIIKGALAALPAIITIMSAQRNNQQEQLEKFTTLLLSQSNDSVSRLVEVMKAQNGPSNGREMLNDFKEMVMGAIDIKDALRDKEESTLDKVIGAVAQAAPFLSQLVSLRQSQREQIPMYRTAQQFINSNPDFQQVRDNPEMLAEMVRRLDAHYGWEQTELILQAMGRSRPEGCPRHEGQRFPAGDERNATAETGDEPTGGEDDQDTAQANA